jgi:hypothetical protein
MQCPSRPALQIAYLSVCSESVFPSVQAGTHALLTACYDVLVSETQAKREDGVV